MGEEVKIIDWEYGELHRTQSTGAHDLRTVRYMTTIFPTFLALIQRSGVFVLRTHRGGPGEVPLASETSTTAN